MRNSNHRCRIVYSQHKGMSYTCHHGRKVLCLVAIEGGGEGGRGPRLTSLHKETSTEGDRAPSNSFRERMPPRRPVLRLCLSKHSGILIGSVQTITRQIFGTFFFSD